MLRKRSRSVQKHQDKGHLMSDSFSDSCLQSEKLGQKQKSSSCVSIPGLFVGFSIKGNPDSDSVRSPASPLDYKVVSNVGNLRSVPNGSHKSWDCSKVGLGLVGALDNVSKSFENVVGLSGSRNILFGSEMRMNNRSSGSCLCHSNESSLAPKSLPKNYAVFPQTQNRSPLQLSSSESSVTTGELQSEPNSLGNFRSYVSDSSRSMSRLTGLTNYYSNSSSEFFCSERKTKPAVVLIGEASSIDNSPVIKPNSLPISIGSENGLVGSFSASDIELSEDYTCIISHGPNPRTIHIFGDCVLECHSNELASSTNKNEEQGIGSTQAVEGSGHFHAYPSIDFLSFCYFCKKKLEEGNDIFMYRGEKAFCSATCRDQEILIEESEILVNKSPNDSPKSTCSDDIFIMGMI